MRLSPRNQLIAVIAGVVVALAVVVVLVLLPQWSRYAEIALKITDSDKRIAQAQNVLKVRQEAKARSAYTSAMLLELLAEVPENPDLPGLIIEMQDLAYRCNVQMRSIEPATPEAMGEYVRSPLTVEIWGTWGDTVDYLQRLSRLSRQVRVLQVATQPNSDADLEQATEPIDVDSVRSVIMLETYIIPAASGTASSSAAPATPAP